MATDERDIRRLAQLLLRSRGFYSGEIDGLWGPLSEEAFDAYRASLDARGLDFGDDDVRVEDPLPAAIHGVVVIDPGHGGTERIGGSSPNNATSASGVLEKTMTLELAHAVAAALRALAQTRSELVLDVRLTREDDRNLGLSNRARVAAEVRADVFLSLHFNGFDGQVRGTETWILSTANGNVNEADDRALAERLQAAVFRTIARHDAGARDRGVRDGQRLGVLADLSLGNTREDHATRACLLEVEFIDVPEVDRLLNGDASVHVREALAAAVAEAIVDDLEAHA
jgi:N-acetylmuramoyl-L-alanine amidase